MATVPEHPVLLLVAAVAVSLVPTIFPGYFVHYSLVHHCYLPHTRKWCVKNGCMVVNWQSFYAFTPSGAKSEYTMFELECLDRRQRKHFAVLLAGVCGVKRIVSIADAPLSETRAIPLRRSLLPNASD